ncbi:MAG: diguanylate cyclase [Fuerstiella sp.]
MTKRRRSLTRLPSLPTIAVEILRVFSDPDVPVKKVADLVQADPAIASKLLKAANSSRFGLRREIADLRQAIVLLGKAKVTPLVLSFSLSADSLESEEAAKHFRHFWLRSFVQASAGEVVGSLFSASVEAECFTTNLLAGIGQLGLLNQGADKYIDVIKQSQQGSQSLADLEREVYGSTHHEISVEMLERSGLPRRCIAAINSLVPDSADRQLDDETQQLTDVTGVADAFARYLCDTDTGVALIVLQERLEKLNADAMDVEQLTTRVRAKLDDSASLFDIDPSALPDSDQLLEDALDQLTEFTDMIRVDTCAVPTELVAENGRLKTQVEHLVRQTTTDALTGIANRAFFDRRLTEMVFQCLRNSVQMGVAVIDIDHFKKVNDTHGHQAGDQILKQVSQALESVTRSDETLARYGGEEFAVLLEDIATDGMAIVGERLRATIEELDISFEGTEIPITVSVGVCCGVPTNSEFGLKLFSRADNALYQAKQSGRNRAVVDSSLSSASVRVSRRVRHAETAPLPEEPAIT